jgi:hypothetical protein
MSTQLKGKIEDERAAHESYVTFEEFLTLDGERTCSEWIDGKVIFMTAVASLKHQLVSSF